MVNAKEAVEDTGVQIFCDIGYINSNRDDADLEYMYIANDFLKNGGENFLFETLPEFTPVEVFSYNPFCNQIASFPKQAFSFRKYQGRSFLPCFFLLR